MGSLGFCSALPNGGVCGNESFVSSLAASRHISSRFLLPASENLHLWLIVSISRLLKIIFKLLEIIHTESFKTRTSCVALTQTHHLGASATFDRSRSLSFFGTESELLASCCPPSNHSLCLFPGSGTRSSRWLVSAQWPQRCCLVQRFQSDFPGDPNSLLSVGVWSVF